MGKRVVSDKIDMDGLAELFSIPAWDEIEELNEQYLSEASDGFEDVDEAAAAEERAGEELYLRWHDAVERVAETLFGEHGLELSPLGKDKRRAFQYRITPKEDWRTAAREIMTTLNGVGYFTFDTLREFLDSGPYTPRQAVLSHLGTIANYPKVYGGSTARRLFESAW